MDAREFLFPSTGTAFPNGDAELKTMKAMPGFYSLQPGRRFQTMTTIVA